MGFSGIVKIARTSYMRVKVPVKDIVKDLPIVMNKFYEDKALCTCKKCGKMMERP
jgi:hypothetical protein